LIEAVRRLNGESPREAEEEGTLAGWAATLEVPYVMELVIEARRRLAGYYQVSLDGQSFPTFGGGLADALAHLNPVILH
jgi:hypothetical protein